MDRLLEYYSIQRLLNNLDGYSFFAKTESPDFVIKEIMSGKRIGVEITEYYPHRFRKKAVVKIVDKDFDVTRRNRRLFLGSFCPYLDCDDFYNNCVCKKEDKIELYRKKHPECEDFWLVVLINFRDSLVYENVSVFSWVFSRIFVLEEPDKFFEF